MNKIQFEIKPTPWNDQVIDTVATLIDGTNLVELLRVYETPFTKKEDPESPAGSYMGRPAKTFCELLTDPTLERDPDDPDVWHEREGKSDRKIAILACGACAIPYCWPMLMKITDREHSVVWSDFEQPCRTGWDYSAFGPFEFDKKEYDHEIEKIKEYCSVERDALLSFKITVVNLDDLPEEEENNAGESP